MTTLEGGEDAGRGPFPGATPGYRALVEGCALVPPPGSSWIELSGADRARFLHGQTTCEVSGLAPGAGAYGFFVSTRGRVLADVVIETGRDRLRLELPEGSAEEIAERLARYVVADRVEISRTEPPDAVWIAGPAAEAALGPLLEGAPPPAGWDRIEITGGLELRGERRVGVPAWRLSGERESLDRAIARLRSAGAVEATTEDRRTVRVERGVPRAGVDFDDRHFPQETGLEEWAVSYTKGCYIGQEVVARIHYRGRVNHGLCGLRGADAVAPPPPGPLVDASGEEAGELSSVVASPAVGAAVGLAILHRRWSEAGTELRASGVGMKVVSLPFVEPAG